MVATVSRSTMVSRTSSGSSTDFTASAFNAAEQRRTRKRITAAQLAHLEELYYECSHPTRDQRDALAKRIQIIYAKLRASREHMREHMMERLIAARYLETKSVTIWFQNKRQTDRKVALHNATNSRNVAVPHCSTDKPNITLTTPTSPVYPPEASVSQEEGPRVPSDRLARKQSITRSNALKRVPSNTTSVASTSSTTGVSRARPSLDRVASRSEIRFTDGAPRPRSTSSATLVPTNSSSGNDGHVTGSTRSGAPLSSFSSTLTRSDTSASVPPASPPSSSDPPLWTTMLSSPVTPSSPPPAELVAYTCARKTRTLDWACAAARLVRGLTSPEDIASFRPTSRSSLGPAVSLSEKDVDVREREYEEATTMTEDEAELVTPHGSQDISMPWAGDASDAKSVTRTCYTTEVMHAVGLLNETDKTNMMVMDKCGWEEDEMHAALALCGLRG